MDIKEIVELLCKICNNGEKMLLQEKRLCPNKDVYFTTYRSEKRQFMECNYQKGNICLKDNKECEFHNLYTKEPKSKSAIYSAINVTLFAFAIYGIYCFIKLFMQLLY